METYPADAPLHIGAVAQRTELSVRTIRHYDEIGLVTPSGRSEGGFRLYTQPDIDRLLLIRRMKPLGFTLEEMAELLAVADAHAAAPSPATAEALGRFTASAIERREALLVQLERADEFIALLGALGGDQVGVDAVPLQLLVVAQRGRQGVGGVQDLLARATVDGQGVRRGRRPVRPRELLGEGDDVGRRGAAPPVDRLARVADGGDRVPTPGGGVRP